MAQDIVNNNQSISYTNLDFSSIYTEVLDLIKNLTYRWDPSISDESDPGVILVKLSALIADKCNYNIDKSILEAFPLSVTQDANAQQLYEQLGYYMNWYESASAPVVLNWILDSSDTPTEGVSSYTIPKFTIITNDEESTNYALIGVEGANGVVVSDGILTTDSNELRMVAMEGTPTTYSYLQNGETVITSQMVDKDTHRIYFDTNLISQNGIFITNTKQNNYADWKRVNNIYEQSYNELRYKFGYDTYSNTCYLEFPDNYSELFGDGIEITYLQIDENYNDIPAQNLTKFLVGITPIEDTSMLLNSVNVSIQNYAAASGHKDKESINEAYENYKKTVGTFKTLITLRDYLNYIKSQELDICSNAFVCDRTNDIQSTYKIVSKQHGLDSIIVKVEQVIDKTTLESNFDYKFERTADTSIISGKKYYIINNDTLYDIEDPSVGPKIYRVTSDTEFLADKLYYTKNNDNSGYTLFTDYTVGDSIDLSINTIYELAVNPKANGWYEFVSRVASSHDALTPFSLKFYLLNNSISLNSKQAFNDTFEINNKELDMDSLLSNTAHLEHTYESILPLGENTYKITSDTEFLANKAYYIKANDNLNYILYTDYNIGDSTSSLTTTYYELDVEALLPHTVFFKNIYPLTMNVLTYDSLNTETQDIIQRNIINALYSNVNSSQLDFGEGISIDYLTEIVESSDDRIKSVSFGSIEYITRAVYYDGKSETFKEVTLAESTDSLTFDQKDINSIIAKLIGKDVICKSILSGVTSLLVPDLMFTFHLNQKFINYYNNISFITSQAIIDIGGKDAITTYSSDTVSPVIRQSYTLKPNETILLYRPQLETIREFSSGIHYEYFLYNDIKADQSYELQKNEYVIFYQAYYSDNSTSNVPEGFSVQACTDGVIITPSMDLYAQTDFNALSNFAKAKITPYFETSTDNLYETSTYAFGYVNEIYNSSSILNNSITGTNNIKLQTIHTIELSETDNYKFFWVLKTPDYSNDKSIKTYTLFPAYDVVTERLSDKEKNSYTLKSGEWLYYVDSSYSNLAILGEGTTIYRNCGISGEYDDDNAHTSFSFVNVSEFNESGSNIRFKDGILETITSHINGYDVINPKANGWYEAQGTNPETYERTLDTTFDSSKTYFVLVMDDNSGLYKRIGESEPYEHSSTLQTSDVFSRINQELFMSNINPSEEGWYEIVTNNNSRIMDYYAISEGASYNSYLRYTSSLDDSILSRFIFTDANYTDVDISDVNTYKSISITSDNSESFNYISQRLLVPSAGDESYKAYYTDSTGDIRVSGITVVDNPSDGSNNHTGYTWYEESSPNTFTETTDTHPILLSTQGSLEYPTNLNSTYCFEEVPVNSWDAVSFLSNGYFYKLNSAESTYIWDSNRNNINQLVTSANLSYLLSLYKEARIKYPAAITSSDEDEFLEATNLIDYMINNWKTSITYNHPFKLEDKLGWRTKTFIETEEGETPTHLGIDKNTYDLKADSLVSYTIYPNFVHDSTVKVIVSADAIDILSDVSYTSLTEVAYKEVLDRTDPNVTDLALVRYLEYLFQTFYDKISNISIFGMELPIKIFRFKDLIRLSNKSYFVPNLYVSKLFGSIDPWTCVALSNDEIAEDPINVIEDKWQSVQPNTSLRIVQNEIWAFSEGDILRFETPIINQNSIVWPRFSNTEIPLDFSSYSISYQRNGASIEDLNKLTLQGYDWQGYSHLLLNTSSKDGQKLESNQSIILYEDNGSQLNEVAIINGSDYDNVTFQLKTPVSNVAGRYIDITSQDIYGDIISNDIYEFIPLINSNPNYKYSSDNITYATFEVDQDTSKVINSQVKIPLLLPKGHYLLPVYNDVKGVRYWVSKCIDAHKGSLKYCINSSPTMSSNTNLVIRIGHNLDANSEAYGEHLYGYEKDKFVGSSNSNFYINDTKYHYLDFSIDANPESEDYIKISLAAHLTEYYSNLLDITASPQWFGWYELVDGEYVLSSSTDIAADLLEEVEKDSENLIEWSNTHNPSELGWYEQQGSDSHYYILSSDTTANITKTYYKDKDFYLPVEETDDAVLKINADNPLEDLNISKFNIIFEDVFKYKNNPLFNNELFNEIKLKLRRLDDESIYNYAFVPSGNESVNDPLVPKSFFETEHPFNKFTIPQLDFDNLECRFSPRNTSRR